MPKTLTEPGAVREQDLLGAWRLESWEIAYDDGRPTSHPFGADPTGLILYTADGYMSATICRRDRPLLSNDNVRRAPEPEKARAFESYFHYAGTWRLKGGRVTHAVTHALNPNFVGTAQIRDVDLAGDRLALSAVDTTLSGARMTNRLVWRRP